MQAPALPPPKASMVAGATGDLALAAAAKIASECAKRDAEEEHEVARRLILRIWEATAHAISKDLESGVSVFLDPLGTFRSLFTGAGNGMGTGGESLDGVASGRLPCEFTPSPSFLKRYELKARPEDSQRALATRGAIAAGGLGPPASVLQPSAQIRFSPVAVARAAEVDSGIVLPALQAFIHHMGKAMQSSRLLVVSFAPIGNFSCQDKIVTLLPVERPGAFSPHSVLPTVRAGSMKQPTPRRLLQLDSPRQPQPPQLPPPKPPPLELQEPQEQEEQQTERGEEDLDGLEEEGEGQQPQRPAAEPPPQRRPQPPGAAPQRRSSSASEEDSTRRRSLPKPATISPYSARRPQPPLEVNIATKRLREKSGTARVVEDGRPLYRNLPEEGSQYPPILNDYYSRTLAVPYTGANEIGSPSSRIAVGRAGVAAAWLTTRVPGKASRALHRGPDSGELPHPVLPGRVVDYTKLLDQLVMDGSPLDAEIQEAGLDRQAFYESLHRYKHYMSAGVPNGCIAPYNELWITNVGKHLDVTRCVAELTADLVDSMLSAMREEVLEDYLAALKKAIVDHIFSDERARKRAGVRFVPNPPAEWGTVDFVGIEGTDGRMPAEWQGNIAQSRAFLTHSLATCSQSTLQLLALWHQKFADLLLVNVNTEAGSGPLMELHAFCAAQAAHRTAARRDFEEVWLDEATEILRRGRSEEPAFYEAVSALLSLQARSVVERSIDAYVSFFQRFANQAPRSPQQAIQSSEADPHEDSFLVLGLAADQGDIRFRTDHGVAELSEVADRLLAIFHDFVVGLHELQRPDTKLGRVDPGGSRNLREVATDEPRVVVTKAFVTHTIQLNLKNAEQALNLYTKYKHLLNEDVRARQLADDQGLTRDDYISEVDKLRATEAEIREHCPRQIWLQMVCIDCAELNDALCKKASEAVQILMRAVLRNLLVKNDQLVTSFEAVVNHMVKKPSNELELSELETQVEEFRSTGLKTLLSEFEDVRKWLAFLFKCEDRLNWAMLTSRHYSAIYDSASWVASIDQVLTDREGSLRRERKALEDKFVEQRDKFLEDLQQLGIWAEKFKKCGSIRQADEYLERLQVLKDHFAMAHQEAEKLNEKELRLGWEPSDFEKLRVSEAALEPHWRLWNMVHNFDKSQRQWLRGPTFQLEPAKVESEANTMLTEAQDLRNLFNDLELPMQARVAADVEKEIISLKSNHLRLVHSLCNKGLRPRHWEQISSIVGFLIEPDTVFTLSRLMDMGVKTHMHELHSISEAATKEHAIENDLNAMQEEWRPIQLELQSWRQTGSHAVQRASFEETRGLVEEHLVKTRVMRMSPHVTPWAQKASEWETWLELMATILRDWEKLQQAWTYLQPVFGAQDFLRQMPTEGRSFRQVDKFWRELMERTFENSAALEITREENLSTRLKESCDLLDEVQKGLNDYLEAKRLGFARFFFLTNDELLEILTAMQEPRPAQHHMKMCFSGIRCLEFLPETDDILKTARACAMVSTEGESASFAAPVSWEASTGGAEEWFTELESAMTTSVRQFCLDALSRRGEVPRSVWIREVPSQAGLCISMVLWTQTVSQALAASDLASLSAGLEKGLQDLISLTQSEPRPLTRKLCESLILLDVHNAHVVRHLVASGVATEDDFDWLAQLRFYAEQTTVDKDALDPDEGHFDIVASMAVARLPYDYEFLGDCSRLVLTPLTDRVHRSMCCAMHFSYGVALEGPSGTGKSETVQELAKTLGRRCVVWRCSSENRLDAMSRFVKGSAASGAWCLLANFDSLAAEVLSVIARQLLSVQQAMLRQAQVFDYEGTALKLKPSCFICASITATSHRWRLLPENLRALLRPVAMITADSSTIAEARLLISGFQEAARLAPKLDMAFQMFEELLSCQPHYDFGLRARLAVLAQAHRLRLMPAAADEDEGALLCKATAELHVAKLADDDRPIFFEILHDVFPEIPPATELAANLQGDVEVLRSKVRESMGSGAGGMQHVEYLETKALQLYEGIQNQHGVVVVGDAHSGKTTSINTLASAMSLGDATDGSPPAVKVETIHPLALSLEQFYGSLRGRRGQEEWSDGILVMLLRKMVEKGETGARRFWLHLDGKMQADWAEGLHPLLDNSRKLCLESGETVTVPSDVMVIFETSDLADASPATVSRCAAVHFASEELGYKHLLAAWLATRCPTTFDEQDRLALSVTCSRLIDPLLHCAVTELTAHLVPPREPVLVQSTLELLTVLLTPLQDEPFCTRLRTQGSLRRYIDACVILACAWIIGSGTARDMQGRQVFDGTMRRLLCGEGAAEARPQLSASEALALAKSPALPPLPPEGSCFDYMWDAERAQWGTWLEVVSEAKPPDANASTIMVRTMDTVRYGHLASACCRAQVQFLFCGPRSVGKTMLALELLGGLATPSASHPSAPLRLIPLACTARTRAGEVQEAIDKLSGKRERDASGPPPGSKCIVFIDDLSLPMMDGSNSRPPLEFFRQLCCIGGWYNRGDQVCPFRRLIDSFLGAAMLPPGSAAVSPRLMRHFRVFGLLPPDQDTILSIFSRIAERKLQGDASDEAKKLGEHVSRIVEATATLYGILGSKLPATPSRPHYVLSLRDVARVVEGTLRLHKKEAASDAEGINRFWVHEVLRSFSDRLASGGAASIPVDRERLNNAIEEAALQARFKLDTTLLTPTGEPIYNDQDVKDEPEELLQRAERVLQTYKEEELEEANLCRLDLLLCPYAVMQALRIARGLSPLQVSASSASDRGISSVLVVARSGSGRRPLTRLACWLAEQKVHENSAKDAEVWRSDLKDWLQECLESKEAGEGAKKEGEAAPEGETKKEGEAAAPAKPKVQTMIIFGGPNLQDQSLEDVHGLICASEVPNLWTADERTQNCNQLRVKTPPPEKEAAGAERPSGEEAPQAEKDAAARERPEWSAVLERFRERCRFLMCLSPSESCQRLRHFPAFLHRSSAVIWLDAWPASALQGVAERIVTPSFALPTDDTSEIERALPAHVLDEAPVCAKLCCSMHNSMEGIAQRLLAQQGRPYHVTLSSYFVLLSTFVHLRGARRKLMVHTLERKAKALAQVRAAEAALFQTKQFSITLQPDLAERRRAIQDMVKAINKGISNTDEMRGGLGADEAAEEEHNKRRAGILKESERERNAALLRISEAVGTLEGLPQSDLNELKNMKNPSVPVRKVLEVTSVMKGMKVTRFRDDDSWAAAVKLVLEPSFVQSLQKLDVDKVPGETMKRAIKLLADEDLELSKVQRMSKVIGCLHRWVSAVAEYDTFLRNVQQPMEAQLEATDANFREIAERLAEKRQALASAEQELERQKAEMMEREANKLELEAKVETVAQKISRVESILASLTEERAQWAAKPPTEQECQRVAGEVLLAAAAATHHGAVPAALRRRACREWSAAVAAEIYEDEDEDSKPDWSGFSLASFLQDEPKVMSWGASGLPSNPHSLENGAIFTLARRVPLCIDPQGLASKWLRKMEEKNQLVVARVGRASFELDFESATQNTFPVLVEDIGLELDAMMKSILRQRTATGLESVLTPEAEDEEQPSRIYLTTRLRFPHYSAEICAMVTFVDFTMTAETLAEQLFLISLTEHDTGLAASWVDSRLESSRHKMRMRELETEMLELLAGYSGDIIENEGALDSISSAKQGLAEIEQSEAALTELTERIDGLREHVVPVVAQAAACFTATSKMNHMSPMYEYSSELFVRFFARCCKGAAAEVGTDTWSKNVLTDYARMVYRTLHTSVFKCHRLAFAVAVASELAMAKPLDARTRVDPAEYEFLASPLPQPVEAVPKGAEWVGDAGWAALCSLANLEAFAGISETFVKHQSAWRAVCEAEQPVAESFPGLYSHLTHFQRVLVLQCMWPSKVIPALSAWAQSALGVETLHKPQPLALDEFYPSSTSSTPLLFLLSDGGDPLPLLLNFATRHQEEVRMMSMGPGQGERADALVAAACKNGGWVFVQNCHLAPDWMASLSKMLYDMKPESVKPGFRLWLSSRPCSVIPTTVLEASIKIAVEPRGIKATMRGLLATNPLSEEDFFSSCREKNREWKRWIYDLLLVHAVVLGRRRFGAVGWSVAYDFAPSDFQMSMQLLQGFLKNTQRADPSAAAAKAFRQLCMGCNYGGRLHEEPGRHLMQVLMSDCGSGTPPPSSQSQIVAEWTGVWESLVTQDLSYEGFCRAVDELPSDEEMISSWSLADSYGLHANAALALEQEAYTTFFTDLCSMVVGDVVATTAEPESLVATDILQVLNQLPIGIVRLPGFLAERKGGSQKEEVAVGHGVAFLSVLVAEISRYNNLLNVVVTSLRDTLSALQGSATLSGELGEVADAIAQRHTPSLWLARSYLSLKPLGSYVADFVERFAFVSQWSAGNSPIVFWIGGFFCPQSLLLGAVQTFARKRKHPIESVDFGVEVLQKEPSRSPEDGAYVRGLYLESCRWDKSQLALVEPEVGANMSVCPIIWLLPCVASGSDEAQSQQRYHCPVYTLPTRAEVDNCRPYQQNYLFSIALPSHISVTHWTKRGAAALVQLPY